jgi:pyridoxine kinase
MEEHTKNINTQKRVLAISDISCVGKCSLTVALPIISAFGIETSVLPTAILSTHTGGFTGYTYRDLTGDIFGIVEHLASLGLHFNAIYTGFLGSIEQVDIVKSAIDTLRSEDTQIIVDPAMADNGKLYASFGENFPRKMRELCCMADIIVPNTTEAALLLEEEYTTENINSTRAREILEKLCQLSEDRLKKAVLTGVQDKSKEGVIYGAASFDARAQSFDFYGEEKIGDMYHGSGDVWASVLVGALVSGQGLEAAMRRAVSFTKNAIARTHAHKRDERFGLEFEENDRVDSVKFCIDTTIKTV